MTQTHDWIDGAEVVVIGGGVIGCSVAYHCAKAGLTDVLLIERGELGAATTARAAGLISMGRTDVNAIRMTRYTQQVIPELEAETGQPLDFRGVGNMRVAYTEQTEGELARLEAPLGNEKVPVERLDEAAARALCPWLDTSAARLRLFLADSGYIDGARLAMAYAQAARGRGARIWRGVEVADVVVDGAAVAGVRTSRGAVRAKWVVDAAGAWSAVLARAVGAYVAAVPTRSHFWITTPNASGTAPQAVISLPDYHAYTRPELGGILIGMQEPVSKTFNPFELPSDVERIPLFDRTADLDILTDQLAPLREIAPAIDQWQFAHHIAGLSMYTPDSRFLIGGFDGLAGLMVASGCSGSGVGASGGIGRLTAELIGGQPTFVDAALFRPDRFGSVDPASDAFRLRCAKARAGKSRGRVEAA